MVSVRERAQQKVENKAKWLDENPGFDGLDEFIRWVSRDYPESEPNINIGKELLASDAFRSFSRIAILVYLDFLCKRFMKRIKRNNKKVWVIENNGKISFPYTEAEKLGYSRQQFVNAIDELQVKGFIDIKHRGHGGRKPAKGTGDFTLYWIDDRWKQFDIEKQTAVKPPRNPRRKDTRKNRGFALIWKNREKGEGMLKQANTTRREKQK